MCKGFVHVCLAGVYTYLCTCYKAYAQGVTWYNSGYLPCIVVTWWKKAGALCGHLVYDAVLAFLIQICVLIQQTG